MVSLQSTLRLPLNKKMKMIHSMISMISCIDLVIPIRWEPLRLKAPHIARHPQSYPCLLLLETLTAIHNNKTTQILQALSSTLPCPRIKTNLMKPKRLISNIWRLAESKTMQVAISMRLSVVIKLILHRTCKIHLLRSHHWVSMSSKVILRWARVDLRVSIQCLESLRNPTLTFRSSLW